MAVAEIGGASVKRARRAKERGAFRSDNLPGRPGSPAVVATGNRERTTPKADWSRGQKDRPSSHRPSFWAQCTGKPERKDWNSKRGRAWRAGGWKDGRGARGQGASLVRCLLCSLSPEDQPANQKDAPPLGPTLAALANEIGRLSLVLGASTSKQASPLSASHTPGSVSSAGSSASLLAALHTSSSLFRSLSPIPLLLPPLFSKYDLHLTPSSHPPRSLPHFFVSLTPSNLHIAWSPLQLTSSSTFSSLSSSLASSHNTRTCTRASSPSSPAPSPSSIDSISLSYYPTSSPSPGQLP